VSIAISGKLLAYLVFEMLTVLLYLIVLPYFYGVPRLGSAAAVLFFAVPFILSVGALGLGAVARLVGIEVGVVSGVINLESPGVGALGWRLRHEEAYHAA
jgi:hypothetical protein